MNVRVFAVFLLGLSGYFFPQRISGAESVPVKDALGLGPKTNFNNTLGGETMNGKSTQDERKIKAERDYVRRQLRLNKKEKQRQARIKKQIRRQNKIILNKIKAVEEAKKKNH